jgi:predicted Abi (CAAX) family protease
MGFLLTLVWGARGQAIQLGMIPPELRPVRLAAGAARYQPVADWQGRLILPTVAEYQAAAGRDWVWLELRHAPTGVNPAWLGQKLRLEWADIPALQAGVAAVTRDLQFSEAARVSQSQGNIHPQRLQGRQSVGPLQSLAGAHPQDDVLVALADVTLKPALPPNLGGLPTLQISQEPLQITGQYYALVKFLEPADERLYWVQHYNRQTQRFDSAKEKVLLPNSAPNHAQIRPFSRQDIQKSAAGIAGWYIYGAKNTEGHFVVEAILPRRLVMLAAQQSYQGNWAGLHYLKQQQWQHPARHKGQLQTVQLNGGPLNGGARVEDWQLGDRALVLHLFGGIGGQKAEIQAVPGTVTGHFSYGWAKVIREPLADELQFQLDYQQVYAHNPEGIIAGRLSWPAYMGNLQRGWLGTRPVSDILVDFAPLLVPYQFPGFRFDPVLELQQQLQLMTARYRIGNGTGAALVNPAQSCVQDSSQAVFITIKRLEDQINAHPQVQAWLQTHPQAPETLRFQQLRQLRGALARQLTPLSPLGQRADWQHHADSPVGVAPADQPGAAPPKFWDQVLSWRTVLPRVAHDQLATTFYHQGAGLRILRTNQVGGWDPTILPLAPSQLLEAYGLPYLFSRLIEAITAGYTGYAWGVAGLGGLGYAALAYGYGVRYARFLKWQPAYQHSSDYWRLALQTLVAPGLIEEILFRVLLIPHPSEAVTLGTWLGWAALSLGLFIVYHPLNALSFYPAGRPTFLQSPFLILATGLGLTCSIVYGLTGSLWPITLIHGLAVFVWLGWLGGLERLHLQQK